jgi:hypothetical protein
MPTGRFYPKTATQFFEAIEQFFADHPEVDNDDSKCMYLAASIYVYGLDREVALDLVEFTYDSASMTKTINLN